MVDMQQPILFHITIVDAWTSGQRDHKGDKGVSQIAAPLAGRDWVYEQCHVIMFHNMFESSSENHLVPCFTVGSVGWCLPSDRHGSPTLSDWKNMPNDPNLAKQP